MHRSAPGGGLDRLLPPASVSVLDYVQERANASIPVVLWSGGRDSTALLAVCAEYMSALGGTIDALFMPYPAHVVDREGLLESIEFWERRGAHVYVGLDDEDEPDVANPDAVCSACKGARRRMLTRLVGERYGTRPITYITGHSLEDVAAYVTEVCIERLGAGVATPPSTREIEVRNRLLEVYPAPDGSTIARPMVRLSETDIGSVLDALGVTYPTRAVPSQCRWATTRKRTLIEYFRAMHVDLDFERICAFADASLGPIDVKTYGELPVTEYLL